MSGRRKAIIAGVGPGNGMAIARKFANAGYDLALLARSKDKLKAYADELSDTPIKTKTLAVDFADITKTERKVDEAIRKIGGVDVLIYNASLYRKASWRDYAPSDFMGEITVAAGTAYAAFRAAGKRMKGGGAIVATGSGVALRPETMSDAPGLSVAKAALRNLVIAMHEQFAADNIFLSTVTVDGLVKSGTFFDPENIAEAIHKITHLPREEWRAEYLYTDKAAVDAV